MPHFSLGAILPSHPGSVSRAGETKKRKGAKHSRINAKRAAKKEVAFATSFFFRAFLECPMFRSVGGEAQRSMRLTAAPKALGPVWQEMEKLRGS